MTSRQQKNANKTMGYHYTPTSVTKSKPIPSSIGKNVDEPQLSTAFRTAELVQ